MGLGAIALACLLSATLYVSLVYETVTKPSAHLFVVGPTVKASSIHPEEDWWIDLPRVFSAASATRTAQGLSSHPQFRLRTCHFTGEISRGTEERSFEAHHSCVYYSGILSVASDKPAVLDSSKHAGMPTHATEICDLIKTIKGCDASIGIHVLDYPCLI